MGLAGRPWFRPASVALCSCRPLFYAPAKMHLLRMMVGCTLLCASPPPALSTVTPVVADALLSVRAIATGAVGTCWHTVFPPDCLYRVCEATPQAPPQLAHASQSRPCRQAYRR